MHRQVSVSVSLVTGQARYWPTYHDSEGSEASIARSWGAALGVQDPSLHPLVELVAGLMHLGRRVMCHLTPKALVLI